MSLLELKAVTGTFQGRCKEPQHHQYNLLKPLSLQVLIFGAAGKVEKDTLLHSLHKNQSGCQYFDFCFGYIYITCSSIVDFFKYCISFVS